MRNGQEQKANGPMDETKNKKINNNDGHNGVEFFPRIFRDLELVERVGREV